MQIRYRVKLTFEEYIEQEAWQQAELKHCPFHPDGSCGYARHGTYRRKFPSCCFVARYYCREAHQSISLLPDFFASRLPGTLDEVEHVVNTVEESSSLEKAAFKLRPEISLTSGLRWLRRRLKYVDEILTILTGLLVTGSPPDLKSYRRVYNIQNVLTGLRDIAEEYLQSLPPIIGFGPRSNERYCHLCSSNN